jgi:hypothetical protein
MKKKTFPLSEVYRLLEPEPVVLVTTARAGRANIALADLLAMRL